jgi:hypothetical protein
LQSHRHKENGMEDKIFVQYEGDRKKSTLPGLCANLLEQQKSRWTALADGVAALDHVRVRELRGRDFTATQNDTGAQNLVSLQFNPARIISSAAAVDPQSIKERPCFLCLGNLPVAQKGILYRQAFMILCNPFPIMKRHYTISKVDHAPQALAENVAFLLELAKDLSPDFNVFYNGPRCGASAPDHMHFQAAPAGLLPFEKELQKEDNGQRSTNIFGVSICRAGTFGREVLVMEGSKPANAVETALLAVMDRLKRAIPTSDEPMMNLLCSYREKTWRIVMFLRRKHRPDVYFRDGEERILISPGLIDMAGLVITPVEKDFAKVDAETMEGIYREISLERETVLKVMDY